MKDQDKTNNSEDKKDIQDTQKDKKTADFQFEGKYIEAIGKRKTSSAQARLYQDGKGIIFVNGKRLNEYFDPNLVTIVNQPLKLAARLKDVNISVLVQGGGKKSQSEAVRHGIAKVLITIDEELKPKLRAKGWIARDARKKERKKPGLKKARRAPQWSKR